MRSALINSHSILNRTKNHLCQLSNVPGFNEVRRVVIRDTYNKEASARAQCLWEWVGYSKVEKFLFWIRNCLKSGRSQSLYIFIIMAMKLTAVINDACYCHQLHLRRNEKYVHHSWRVVLAKLTNGQQQVVQISYTEFNPSAK